MTERKRGASQRAAPSAANSLPLLRKIAGVAIVLVAAELFTRSGFVDENSLPPLSKVLAEAASLIVDPEFLVQLWATVKAWLIGLILSTILGAALGYLLAVNEFLYRSFRALLDIIRPIPSVALIPLGILILGQGTNLKIVLVIYAATWPIFYNVLTAVHGIDRIQQDSARIFGIGRARRMRRVTLPSVLPDIATGIRVASPIALILAVSVELLGGGTDGLGAWILNASLGSGRADLVLAGTFIIGLLGVLSNWGLLVAERKALPWHPSHRESAKAVK